MPVTTLIMLKHTSVPVCGKDCNEPLAAHVGAAAVEETGLPFRHVNLNRVQECI